MIGAGVVVLALLWAAPRSAIPRAVAPTPPAPPPPATPTPAPAIPSLLNPPPTATPSTEPDADPELLADRRAGVEGADVPPAGTGGFTVVPGTAPAPAAGPVRPVRVQVEGGLPVDPAVFAEFVMATLNDPRGWGRGLGTTFARTDGPADIVVVLASPETTERLCQPVTIEGMVSCRTGPFAVINFYRWVLGQPDFYGRDRTGYRQYVINHEVGHVFGNGHQSCPGPGRLAPVMQQQTLGLAGCLPNPWPYP